MRRFHSIIFYSNGLNTLRIRRYEVEDQEQVCNRSKWNIFKLHCTLCNNTYCCPLLNAYKKVNQILWFSSMEELCLRNTEHSISKQHCIQMWAMNVCGWFYFSSAVLFPCLPLFNGIIKAIKLVSFESSLKYTSDGIIKIKLSKQPTTKQF